MSGNKRFQKILNDDELENIVENWNWEESEGEFLSDDEEEDDAWVRNRTDEILSDSDDRESEKYSSSVSRSSSSVSTVVNSLKTPVGSSQSKGKLPGNQLSDIIY